MLAFGFAPMAIGGSLPSLIAYKLGDYGGSDGIFLLGPGQKTGTPVFGETKGAVYLGSPAWSPNGDVLAFEHDGNQLMFANRAGHLMFKLGIPQGQTTGSSGIAWSPDGKEIAYLCYEGHLTSYMYAPINVALPGGTANLPNLCIYNVVTGVNRVAAESTLADSITNGEISWARDGSMIATDTQTDILSSSTELCVNNHVAASVYVTSGPPCNLPSISIVDVGSGSIAPIGKPFFTEPAFSTKGSEIAFQDGSGGAAHSKLETMSASGGDVRVVTDLDSSILADPAWSPNDKQIAYAGTNPNGDGSVGLYEINADGSGRKQATTFSIYATQWLSTRPGCSR